MSDYIVIKPEELKNYPENEWALAKLLNKDKVLLVKIEQKEDPWRWATI